MAGVALLAGGTGSTTTTAPVAYPTDQLHGVLLQSASCAQWTAANVGERKAAIRGLTAAVAGRTTTGVEATTLSPARAYRTLDRVCASRFTQSFLLYEMYIRAAGFKSFGSGG